MTDFPPPASFLGRRPRLLCLEDEPSIADIVYRSVGRQFGWEVDTAESGEEALELIRGRDYDVLLLDIVMRGMDGIDLYRHLERERPELTSRILWTTGMHLDPAIVDFIERTGCPALYKPFDLDVLMETLVGFLDRQRRLRAPMPPPGPPPP